MTCKRHGTSSVREDLNGIMYGLLYFGNENGCAQWSVSVLFSEYAPTKEDVTADTFTNLEFMK